MGFSDGKDTKALITEAENGFNSLNISRMYIKKALQFLEAWLAGEDFEDYMPQIENLVKNKQWEYLLDSFYQIIPFGTGGRRGEVGVGPNRINPWTIKSSAQGHSQFLIKKYGEGAKERGVVFAYDVRQFLGNKFLDDSLPNPVKNLKSADLAVAAAGVYAANGIKVYIFDSIRTTPELSFAIRHLGAVAGAMFSASHNPPDHNGKKVYDEYGGQLIPPFDEELVAEVAKNVKELKNIPYEDARQNGLIEIISPKVDEEYVKSAAGVSLSNERGIKIAFTPLHGCGMTSVFRVMESMGFDIHADPETSNPSGRFENVIFNIPNPEVIQSFDTTLKFAKEIHADIILNSDPDADRIGIMVNHSNEWIFLGGNEIAVILGEYVIQKRKNTMRGKGVMIKTMVTTNLLKKICEKNGVEIIGELLIGFKYIGDTMNNLESQGRIDDFLFACEESHGYLAGNYARDKDAVTAALWLAELSAELKKNGNTLVDYLEEIYSKYGYFKNYLTEVRMFGAAGKEKIDLIQASLRSKPPTSFGKYKVINFEDCQQRLPIVSDTDKSAKDVLVFNLLPVDGVESIKVTIRPSGTEPKIKMYFEAGTPQVSFSGLKDTKNMVGALVNDLEKAVMKACYEIIGVDFPDRGFLLFWQLPLDIKTKYFEVEPEIEKLKGISDKEERKEKFYNLVSFLGANPVEKMDGAFKAKYKVSVLEYLSI